MNGGPESLHGQPSKTNCGCEDEDGSFSASAPLRLFQLSASVNPPAGTLDTELSLILTGRDVQKKNVSLLLRELKTRALCLPFLGRLDSRGLKMTWESLWQTPGFQLRTNKPFTWVLANRQSSFCLNVWTPYSSTNMLGTLSARVFFLANCSAATMDITTTSGSLQLSFPPLLPPPFPSPRDLICAQAAGAEVVPLGA